MLEPKQRIPTNLPIKAKSPYAQQLEDFEKRSQRNKNKVKLPTIPMRNRKLSLLEGLKDDEYLQLAKKLINNKEKITFGEDKENMF